MREIKFRAWIDDAALCNEDEIINHLDENGEFIPFMQNLEYWYFDEGQTLSDYLANFGKGNVMQYTGLKDKNGVEIYEGDILRKSPKDKWEMKNYTSYECWFDSRAEYGCGWKLSRARFHGCVTGVVNVILPIKELDKYEVIGNIFEDEDLLKED